MGVAYLEISNAQLTPVVPVAVRLVREEQSFFCQRAVEYAGHNFLWQVVWIVDGSTNASCKLWIIARSVNTIVLISGVKQLRVMSNLLMMSKISPGEHSLRKAIPVMIKVSL